MKKALTLIVVIIGFVWLISALQPSNEQSYYPPTSVTKTLGTAVVIKTCYTDTTTTEAIINLTNVERVKGGLRPLVHDSRLDASAMLKAQDMVALHYWSHDSPTGVKAWHWFRMVNYVYKNAGENLAENYRTNEEVITGWMNSSGHRYNVLKPVYEDIGVAVLCGVTDKNTTLVVAHYGN